MVRSLAGSTPAVAELALPADSRRQYHRPARDSFAPRSDGHYRCRTMKRLLVAMTAFSVSPAMADDMHSPFLQAVIFFMRGHVPRWEMVDNSHYQCAVT